MKGTYFRTLIPCASVSVSLLLIAAYVASRHTIDWVPRWIYTVVAIAPMGFYHYSLYRAAKKASLDVPAIDSVYYYGFLLTVAALALSAIEVGLHVEAGLDLHPVLNNFAVGLSATGYAVVARMHLTSVSTFGGMGGPEEVMDRYLKRSLELVDNVDHAAARLAVLSKSIMANTSAVADSARVATEKTVREVGRAFDAEMKASLSDTRQSLQEIRQMTSDPDFAAERRTMSANVRATHNAVARLTESLSELAEKTKDSADATGHAVAATTGVAASLTEVGRHLTDLGGPAGTLPATLAAFDAASRGLAAGSLLVGDAIDSMAGLSESISRAKGSFDGLPALAAAVADALDQLADMSAGLRETTDGVAESSSATRSLAEALVSTSSVLPQVTQRATELTTMLDQLRDRIAKAAEALEGDVDRSAKAATMLTESLARVAQTIVDRTSQHQASSV